MILFKDNWTPHMLNPEEKKIVVSTLTQRRAWLKKALEQSKDDDTSRHENITILRILESALKKLGSSQTTTTTPSKDAPEASGEAIVSTPTRSKLTLETARILVAEDDEDSAKLLSEILFDIGIKHVDIAKDGRIAFEKIKSIREGYDLILCDWDMPELKGLEVHKKALHSNTLRGAYFFLVTAVSEVERIREAIKQGVNDYIVKPIDIDTIEAKVKAAIAARIAEGKK